MTKEGFEKQLYLFIRQAKITKKSNIACLLFNLIPLVFLIFGSFPTAYISKSLDHKLVVIYGIIAIFLLLDRVLWVFYSQSIFFGIFEVIATYANSFLIIYMLGDSFNITKLTLLLIISCIVIYSTTWSLIGVWYESKGIKDKKVMAFMFYSLIIASVITIPLYIMTGIDFFAAAEIILISSVFAPRIILYFLALKFPWKNKFYQKYGKKQASTTTSPNILSSSIFINKKNKKNK